MYIYTHSTDYIYVDSRSVRETRDYIKIHTILLIAIT